jgi:uncharacterized membrane protein YagU involved in acid resistance
MKLNKTQQSVALFVILFIHFTVMDLVVVTTNETLILLDESLRLETIFVHFLAAFLATFLYFIVAKMREVNVNSNLLVGDRVWFACSVALLGMIGFFMM